MLTFLAILTSILGAGSPAAAHLPADHAIYIGVVQIDHSGGGPVADVRVKVFTDDLQSALRNASSEYRITPPEACCAANEALIERYFQRRLTCRVNDRPLTLTLTSCEKENDVFLLTFRMPCPAAWRTVSLTADFFMELFPTQSNVISLLHGQEKRLWRATRERTEGEAVFGG